VAFESEATNLVAGDTNGFFDIFVHDRQTGATTRVSVDSAGIEGIGASFNPSISSDGGYVAFESDVDFVADIANFDVYVHDRQTGATTLVSVDSAGTPGDLDSTDPCISSDGRYVAFESIAIKLVAPDTNGNVHIFVRDLLAGTTTLVSVDSVGAEGNGDSSSCSISSDGRYVAFVSNADNLLGVGNDNNGFLDVFVHDLQTGTTTLASVDSAGIQGNGVSNFPSISGDGRYVAFVSDADNLLGVGNDNNVSTDVFVHDRDADGNGTYDEPGGISTVRVSVDLDGVEGNDDSNSPSMSADGKSVTFKSDATNLVAGDTNLAPDIFVDDLQAGAGGGGGSSSGGGGCFIATAADGSGMAGEK
jgi:Tol biopolymer transport system component